MIEEREGYKYCDIQLNSEKIGDNSWFTFGTETPQKLTGVVAVVLLHVPEESVKNDSYRGIYFISDYYDDWRTGCMAVPDTDGNADVTVPKYVEDHFKPHPSDDEATNQHYYCSLTVFPPEKTVYQVGETLDLTGGKLSASGFTPYQGHWDVFYDPLDKYADYIDLSEFDNSTPGTYPVYVHKFGRTQSFEVTVVPGEGETIPATEAAETVPTGVQQPRDINGDGSMDIMDVICVNKFLIGAGKLDEQQKKLADLDGNGMVESTDSLALLKLALGL